MRFEIEQRERAERARVLHRRRQLQRAFVHRPRHQVQAHVEHGGAAAAAIEMRRQRLEQPAQDERQRLQAVDRPLEIERLLEALLRHCGQQRPRILASRQPLPPDARLPETGGDGIGRQLRDIAERPQSPLSECRQFIGIGGQQSERQGGQGVRCPTVINHGDVVRRAVRKQPCRGRRAGNGDADVQIAPGGGALQLVGDGARAAEQPRETAQIERDIAWTVDLAARGEFRGNLDEGVNRGRIRTRKGHRT